MRPNYKRLAMYYRRRFLDEGRAAAVYLSRLTLAEDTLQKMREEMKCMKEHIAPLEAAHWVKSQIEGGYQKASDVAAEIFAEIDNALYDMAMEYVKAERKDYFAVCEMVHHKVIRPIEKKHTEATE